MRRHRESSHRPQLESLEGRLMLTGDLMPLPVPVEAVEVGESSTNAGGDSLPADSFSLNYAKIEFIPRDTDPGQTGSDLQIVNNGDGSEFFELDHLLITSYQSSGTSGGDTLPTETFSFNFERIPPD